MRYRNFTIDEAAKFYGLVSDLLPRIQQMSFGKRVKSLFCEVDEGLDPSVGVPEIRVRSEGKLSDNHLCTLLSLLEHFPDEDVIGSSCAERLGLRTSVLHKLKSTEVKFRWQGLRKIDSVRPLDFFYSDGTFSPVLTRDKKVEGVVYFCDEKEVRIVSPHVSGKLPWALEMPTVKLTPGVSDINPFGIFESDQEMEDLKVANDALKQGVSTREKRLRSFPALDFVANIKSDFFKKGAFCLPLPGDAMHLFSRSLRADLSRKLRKAGGKGLCRSCWLGVEHSETNAYMVQLTTANSMIKSASKNEDYVVYPVVSLDWESIESLDTE